MEFDKNWILIIGRDMDSFRISLSRLILLYVYWINKKCKLNNNNTNNKNNSKNVLTWFGLKGQAKVTVIIQICHISENKSLVPGGYHECHWNSYFQCIYFSWPTQLKCWGCVAVVFCCGWGCGKIYSLFRFYDAQNDCIDITVLM